MNKELIPLHTHSNYSLLDSMIKIKDYVKWGVNNNLKSLALTDHGVLGGSLKFFKTCKEFGIKPILGLEAYMTFDSPDELNKSRDNYHLILFAKNKKGWLNLIKLHNISYYNMYYKPRITFEDLEKYHEGLICCSACIGGLLPQMILENQMDKFKEYLIRFMKIFKEDFYLEIQDHNLKEEGIVSDFLIKTSKLTNVKLIATNDAHYVNKDDSFAHQVLLCKQTQSKISNPAMKFDTEEFYLKNTQQMREQFSYLSDELWEEIVDNTNEIADKVEEYDILRYEYSCPSFGNPQKSINDLINFAKIGFSNRFKNMDIDKNTYLNRLKYEIETIYKLNLTDYFLMLNDLKEFLISKDIPISFGRGSGAGSLLLYCLEITGLDPIKYNLPFERFINPERVSMADYDWDTPDDRRQEVVDYLEHRYGKDKTCSIATYGELTSVSSFKAVASVLEMDFQEANAISKNLLDTNLSLDENLAQSEELQKLYNTNTLFQKIFDTAKKLEGGLDKRGVHAAGMILCNEKLENITPLMYVKGADGKMVNCMSFEMKEADGDLKLLKMDILGLKNLSIIHDCINRLDNKFDFRKIDFDDKKTYDLISSGNSLGIFQFESQLMKGLLRDIKPKNLSDLSVINALARPGALESSITEHYIQRRKGLEKIDYICNGMEEYLEESLGLVCFQEQLMNLSRVMAGYTMGQADNLRKIVSKKMPEKLKEERVRFVEGATKNGYTKDRANEIFDMIDKWGRYGFSACIDGEHYFKEWGCTIEDAYNRKINDLKLKSYNTDTKEFFIDNVEEIIPSGEQDVYEIVLDNGNKINCTLNHKFLCYDKKYHELQDIIDNDLEIIGE